jgi:hypothetical protein
MFDKYDLRRYRRKAAAPSPGLRRHDEAHREQRRAHHHRRDANRFARDLMVQEVGFKMLRDRGIDLIAADSPHAFVDDGPTSKLIRQVLARWPNSTRP